MAAYGAVLSIVAGFFVLCSLYVVINLLRVCDPNEVLVVSGTTSKIEGRTVGYTHTKGGRMIVLPVINKAHRLDLRNMTIDVNIRGAYSNGGIPLNIDGVANLKLSGDGSLLANAVERFLGRSRVEIMRIAKEVLEGNLRGVLAKLTPEQVNSDKEAFAQSLIDEAEKDLQRLGLVLNNLKIQNVRDDRGYLECLGRKKRAELMMNSRIAEAKNNAESKTRSAENRQSATLRNIENDIKVLQAEAETRLADARTRRDAVVAEVQAEVSKEIAKAEADMAVQTARIEQIRHRLQADVVQPAMAAKERMIAESKTKVAPVLENGKATAQMLTDIIESMQRAGGNARDIFLVQKLDSLLGSLLKTIHNIDIEKITVISQGPNAGAGTSDMVNRALMGSEQLKSTMGVDIPELLKTLAGQGTGKAIRLATQTAPQASAEIDFEPDNV